MNTNRLATAQANLKAAEDLLRRVDLESLGKDEAALVIAEAQAYATVAMVHVQLGEFPIGRQDGGWVTPSSGYMVGESGPERLDAP